MCIVYKFIEDFCQISIRYMISTWTDGFGGQFIEVDDSGTAPAFSLFLVIPDHIWFSKRNININSSYNSNFFFFKFYNKFTSYILLLSAAHYVRNKWTENVYSVYSLQHLHQQILPTANLQATNLKSASTYLSVTE